MVAEAMPHWSLELLHCPNAKTGSIILPSDAMRALDPECNTLDSLSILKSKDIFLYV